MQPALPAHLAPAVRAALTDAAAALRQLYGDRLHHLVLFGSQARGDAHDESDVDVLVVLADNFNEAVEMRQLTRIQVDVLNRHEQLLSLIPFSLSTYRDPAHPLMMNVQEEGVAL